MDMKPQVRAFQYVRISEDWEKRRLGVERQKKETFELAERKGWTITGIYEDNNVSASKYSKKARLEYQRLLKDIQEGQYDAGVFWDQDRLVRKPMELEEFVLICERAGLRLLASIGDSINLSTGDGLLILRIKGAVAAEESRKISARAKSKRRELAESGSYGGGSRSFGYQQSEKSLVIDTQEAKHVRDGAERILAGESLRSLAESWNLAGVLTTQGNSWMVSKIRELFASPRLAGYNKLGVRGDWEPILDKETHDQLWRLLKNPSRRRAVAIRSYLLTGLVYCSGCKTPLTPRIRSDKVPTYFCAKEPGRGGCGKRRILAEPLEDLIGRGVTIALDSPELAKAHQGRVSDQSIEVLRKQASDARASLQELSDDYYVQRIISREEFFANRSSLEVTITSAEKQISELQPANSQWDHKGAELWERWEAIPLGTKRAIIESVVDRVWIGPAKRGVNRFNKDRVFIDWAF